MRPEVAPALLLESIFFDQAALNGTRPDSLSGVKPAWPLVGRYFMVQSRNGSSFMATPEDLSVTGPGFGRWFKFSASIVKKIAAAGRLLVMSSAGGIAFQSLVGAMSSVWK
jgi:hypothetical protein